MSQNNSDLGLGALEDTINYCFGSGKWTPGLILFYSSIDIMASLNRDPAKSKVTRSDFVEWVNRYLLPGSELTCSAIDLYAARCGLVHSYSPDSDLSRDLKAKKIYYAHGNKKAIELQTIINKSSHKDIISVHIDQLFEALKVAVERFASALKSNPSKEKLATQRASEFFINISA